MYIHMAASMLAATATFFIIFSISKTYDSDVTQKTVCAIRAPNAKHTVPLDKAISIRGCCNTRSAESTTYIQ